MRISETRYLVGRAKDALKLLRNEEVRGQGGHDPPTRVVGTSYVRDALSELREAPIGVEFASRVTAMLNQSAIMSVGNVAIVPRSHAIAISALREELLRTLLPLHAALGAAAPPEQDRTILVKLPPVEDLADTAEVLRVISTAFDQPLGRINEQPLQMLGVDSGSTWIVLAARTLGALKFLQNLAAALATLVDAVARYKLNMAQLDALKVDVEVRRRHEELNIVTKEALTRRLAHELAVNPTNDAEAPREVDHELVGFLMNSLKTLHELSQRGAEIRILAVTKDVAESRLIGSTPAAAQLPAGGDTGGETPPTS